MITEIVLIRQDGDFMPIEKTGQYHTYLVCVHIRGILNY